jgi:hypothetical protein
MKKLFNFSGVSGIALFVFLSIIILLSIYFFISLSNKEHTLQQLGFNNLNQLSRAIKEQDETFWQVADNIDANEVYTLKKKGLWSFLHNKGFQFRKKESNNSDEVTYKIYSKEKVTIKKKVTYKDSTYMSSNFSDFLKSLIKYDFFNQYVLIING